MTSVAPFSNPMSVDGRSLYIDNTVQNTYNTLSYGNNTSGFKTPSSNFCPYTVNDDGSITYTEQNKSITVSCSDPVPDLYKVIQPYTYLNTLTDAPITWTSNDQHKTIWAPIFSGSNVYGFWIQYDLSAFGNTLSYNSYTINTPDSTTAPGPGTVFGSNVSTGPWTQLGVFGTGAPNAPTFGPGELTKMYRMARSSTFPYVRFVFRSQGFTLSSLQILNDTQLAGILFGTLATNGPITIGNLNQDVSIDFNNSLYLNNGFTGAGVVYTINAQVDNIDAYTAATLTIGGASNVVIGGPGQTVVINNLMNDTYPPTSNSVLTTASSNVVKQIYNSIPVSTPRFYFRYTGNLSYTAVGGAPVFSNVFNNAALTLAENSLNGLSISTVVTGGKLVFPYNGVYSISLTVTTSNFAQSKLISSTGTYGTNTLGAWGYYGAVIPPNMSYTSYFAANDSVQLQNAPANGSTVITPTSVLVVLITRL